MTVFHVNVIFRRIWPALRARPVQVAAGRLGYQQHHVERLARLALGRQRDQRVESPVGPVVVVVEEVILRMEEQLPQFDFWARADMNFELKGKERGSSLRKPISFRSELL